MTIDTEEIVISGISGRFPESENFDEFAENLFANKDLITEDERRWPKGLNSLPNRMGKLKNIDRFDASFFGLPETVANDTDPQSRLLLETTAEAIFDAGKSNFQNIISREIHDTISGVDLSKLRGTNTGVYIGFTTIGTAEGIPQTDEEAVNNAFLMMGTSRAIYANRINFVFDFRGPSNIMDTACASSMSAIYHAMNDIKSGACDQAVVGGVNLCLAPFSNYLMTAVGAVSATGQSRVFDDKANGYVRSEACVTVFLQRKSSAKRVYATILNCRTNTDGFKKPGLFFPSSEMQSKLMARVCSEAGIDPLSIKYFEAHGTGTRVGDPQEVIAINNTYCNEERTSPLLIGSVKSVVGHSEGASGLVSIAKVLISFEKQMIPANLNFDSSNDLIKDLIPKKIRVVTQNTLFPGGIVGLNSYGIGGVNVNLLLKSNENINNSKKCENQKDKIPRLICLCARNPEMINNLFEFVEKNPGKIDEYFLSLMNNIIHYKPTIGSSGFPCRGYMMARNYSNESTNSCSELEFVKKIKLYSETKPLVFLFPGFGCQWPTMGKSLMPIETFSNTIDELANILTEFNIDLKQILISDDVMALKSCTSIFVAITAIQIALVNVMKMIDIRPDFIIGHSFGEIACAYADGALTSREAILCSFWRGNCLENSSIIPGAMIAVQMSWAEAMKKCEGTRIIAACHNSENSVTLSGPELEILQMKRDFEEENKFVRQIRGVEFPFHTPYLKSVGISMINKLDNIIKQPKNRTVRWLSTSLSEEQLFNSDLNFASSKYFVNNLLSPVYFYEAILKLPENCVIMEIGPHSLFESILKNKSGNSYVSLMKRDDNDNNLIRLLSSVGELYLNGFSPKIENLYPKIEPPVPRGTQSISSLIKWDHGKCYFVRKFPDYYNHVSSSNYTYSIKLGPSSRWNFLKDHVIDGTNLFPGTGYLMLVWQSLAANKNTPWKKLPVEFKDVRILSGTILSNENPVKFIVNVDNSSGQFYVRVGSDIACTGNVSVPREPILSLSCQYEEKMKNQNNLLSLESKDIYKTLRVHGYDFGPKFTGVMKATQDFNCIELRWTGEWISFADSMLHVLPYITGLKSRTILVPTFIESIKCDPRLLYGKIEAELNPEMSENEIKNFTIFYDKNLDAVFSNCLEFQGFQSIPIKRKDNLQGLCMEKYIFVTNNEVNMNDLENRSDRDREPCDTTLANILKEFNFEVKKYLNDEKVENLEENNNSINILRNEMYKFESKFSLNNFLKDIFNNNEIPDGKISFKQFVKIIEKKYSLLRSCDITSNLFADERLLRTQLDIILENHFSDKFSIFEYNDGHSNCLYKFIKNWLKYSPLFEIPFEYKLTNFGEQSFSDYDKEINFEEIHLNKSNTNFLNSMRDYDIVIVNCLSYQPNYEEFVLKLSNIIKEDGFLLIIIRTSLTIPEKFLIKLKNSKLPEPNNAEEMLRISSSVGFNVISTKCFSSSLTTVLLRKKYRIELNKSLILKIHSENFDWVNDLQSKIKELEDEQNDRKIWLIGNEPEIGIIGFINCLRKELKSDRIRCLFDMERSLPENLVELKKKINEISNSNLVFNVWRDGKLGTFRHLTLEKNLMTPLIKAKNYYLKILKRGDLNTLRWFEIPHEDYLETKHKQIPVKVYYATINDTDIDMIYNRSSIDPKLAKHEILLGKEFSGKIKHSDKRVMGIKFSGAISTELFTHEDLLFEIPNDWSLIESATVPFNYFICYYSLYLKGNLRENESVFIRIKDFCLSQAAISICLSRKCQIFVTVVNVHQEKILLDKFGLNSELIFIRENISIKNQILNLTNGRGVDLIFSCDEGYFDDCMHCLKNCGTYLELKKQRILDNQMLPSFEFRRNISFHSIDINYILRYFQYGIKPNPIWERQVKEVRDLFKKGLKNGEIKPFPQKIFKKDQFREAVQMNALDPNLNHKIIIEIQDEKDANSKSISIKATGRCSFNPRKTFIITGGLGGFGFELTKWLFERGARNIILTSRTGIKNNIQKYFIDYFNEKGGHVEVSNLDITSEKQAIHLIERAEKFGQIGGIFHLALVMKDGFFENQNSKQFHEVHIAKFNGLKNLDNITRSRNTDLDLFVAFSSISCGRGNPGQSNYGFSNSSVERLCEMRRKDGLHGLAIQWGPIDDVGVLIERSNKINEDLKHKGLVPQRMPTCFAVLDYVLNLPYAVVSSFTRGESVTEELKTEESLLEQLTVYLGLDYQKISDLATLEDIGVDSLMSLEVQKRLEREFEKSIPLASIKKITVGQLKAVSKRDKTDFLKILKL